MLASFVILLASLATGGPQQERHQVPANQELTFRLTTRRKVSSYAIFKSRSKHRINSFPDLIKHFKFLLLNINIEIAHRLEKVRKTIFPSTNHFIHHSIFSIESSDEEAPHLLR
jgi:hypothetical protein